MAETYAILSDVDMPSLFDKPITEVAALYDVGLSLLKRYCRSIGILRWPYRKVTTLKRLQAEAEAKLTRALQSGPNGNFIKIQRSAEEIAYIKRKLEEIRMNPNAEVILDKRIICSEIQKDALKSPPDSVVTLPDETGVIPTKRTIQMVNESTDVDLSPNSRGGPASIPSPYVQGEISVGDSSRHQNRKHVPVNVPNRLSTKESKDSLSYYETQIPSSPSVFISPPPPPPPPSLVSPLANEMIENNRDRCAVYVLDPKDRELEIANPGLFVSSVPLNPTGHAETTFSDRQVDARPDIHQDQIKTVKRFTSKDQEEPSKYTSPSGTDNSNSINDYSGIGVGFVSNIFGYSNPLQVLQQVGQPTTLQYQNPTTTETWKRFKHLPSFRETLKIIGLNPSNQESDTVTESRQVADVSGIPVLKEEESIEPCIGNRTIIKK